MSSLIYRWTSPHLSKNGHSLLREVINSGQWSYGPVARNVEKEIENRLNVDNALLTNSGTSALWILLSMARKNDQEQAIVVPAFGYSAAANIASSLGYSVYVADSCADAPVVDPVSVEKLIDDKVVFIIGINYFGYSVDWKRIPNRVGYQIIEDAAGSFGAYYMDRPCGSNADLSIVSFHTSKAAAAGGEGGCILAKDAQTIRRAKAVAKNGHIKGYYYSELAGMNMLMTDVSASFLSDTIDQYGSSLVKRKGIVELIDQIFNEQMIETLAFNHSNNNRIQNYQSYSVLVDNRDFILNILRMNGIEARPCWPYLVTEQPAIMDKIKLVDGELENAKKFARNIINIPINPTTSEDQVEKLRLVLKRLIDLRIINVVSRVV